MEKKQGLTIAVVKSGPPKLGAPGEKKSAPPFGPKHEAAEAPEKEASEESAVEKLAYIRAALEDLLAMCGDDEPEEEMAEEPEEGDAA